LAQRYPISLVILVRNTKTRVTLSFKFYNR
jgi:hypothetical protein